MLELLKDDSLPEYFEKEIKDFTFLMLQYKSAIKEIETKFNILTDEFSLLNNRNPVESIKTRLKSVKSIVGKLDRKDLPRSVKAIEDNLNDVAGIRIVTSFIDDIYNLKEMFIRQDDIKVIEEKDYIKSPKENGYRSLHLIVEVPIFLSNQTKNVRVEVQFRTIAMDFWASLEHEIKYKKNVNDQEIYKELKDLATASNILDERMQKIRNDVNIR